MKKGGIFSSFGAADLAGQTLKLAPGGSAPLATAMQQVLKAEGATNLPVDGSWGDCSQQAFINAYGTKPTPDLVTDVLHLWELGFQPSQVQTWDKTPYCKDQASAAFQYKEVDLDKVAIVAQAFGVPVPKDAPCPKEGQYRNVQTGVCEAFEQPPSAPPKMTLASIVRGLSVTKPTVSAVPITSDKLTRVTPSPSTNLSAAKVIFTPKPAATIGPIMQPIQAGLQLLPFFPGSSTGSAASGMGTGAKVALGVVVLGALGGLGYWLWSRSQASAIPNCGWSPNCGEWASLD